jgi:Rab-GTPase-TBC domain/Regulator of chromosome condensation (RCC1) repeat
MTGMTAWGWGRLSISFSTVNPIEISIPDRSIGMFIGRKESLIWTNDGVYSWGENIITAQEHLYPTKMQNITLKPSTVLIQNSMLTLLTDEGDVYKYENNLPSRLAFTDKVKIIACGSEHILALDANGRVYSWGNSIKGQLGQGGNVIGVCSSPRIVQMTNKCIEIACGYNHSMALDELGKVYTWGSGADGRLGHEASADKYEPCEIQSLSAKFIVHLACGYLHSAVISNTGELLTFGFNGYGQLGIGSLETRYGPVIISSLIGRRVLDMACGAFHTICICENGEIYSTGMGNKGQLGIGTNLNSCVPEKCQLEVLNLTHEYAKLYCGTENSFIMTTGKCEMGLISRPSVSDTAELTMLQENLQGGFRPSNLPPKDPTEAAMHKRLVAEQARMYLDRIREKEKITQRDNEKKIVREMEIRDMMKIWETDVLPNWDRKKKTRQVEKLIKKGLPPKVRGEVWIRLIGNPMGITQDYFFINVNKAHKLRQALETGGGEAVGKEGSLKFIKQDISRTFHQLGYFREGSPFNQQLRDLLEAFTLCRPDIGYVQGMSYVAGMLLLNLEPYKAFVMLINIIGSPLLIPFYRLDHAGITRRSQLFRLLLINNLPEVSDHFENEGVNPGMYLIEWFLTLYSRTLNQDVVSRVWDLFFYQGPLVLYQVGIAILKILSGSLLHEDLAGIMGVLAQISNYIGNGDSLVEVIDTIKIPSWIVQEVAYMAEENL